MNCALCHRPLRNPGVPIEIGGVSYQFGPVCAAKMAPPKRKRRESVVLFSRSRRARRVDQMDLFAEAAA